MCVLEVEWFESSLSGSSSHVPGHFKVRAGPQLPFVSVVKLLHSNWTFLAIKVACVQFGEPAVNQCNRVVNVQIFSAGLFITEDEPSQ